MEITFKRVCTGQFDSYLDGVKTAYGIVNGSLGMSGRDTVNTYGVTKNGELVRWLGPLRTCKAMIEAICKKQRAVTPEVR